MRAIPIAERGPIRDEIVDGPSTIEFHCLVVRTGGNPADQDEILGAVQQPYRPKLPAACTAVLTAP